MSWSLYPGHTETPWPSQDLNAMVSDPPALSLTTTLDPLGVGPSQLPTLAELSQAGFRDAIGYPSSSSQNLVDYTLLCKFTKEEPETWRG